MDAQQANQNAASMMSGAQIRSRITVVCAECKRLKLKCDRRTPCGSCVKRDTVSRCTYSPAAAEKIDVQSLHNRVLLLEAQVAQGHGRIRGGQAPGLERALIATAGGSSVFVALDDLTAVWLEQLDLAKDIELRAVDSDIALERPLGDVFPNMALYRAGEFDPPSVTLAMLRLLPPESVREAILAQLEQAMRLHPCFNFAHFRERVSSMLSADPKAERPSLAFFAAAAAGFALGAQSWLEANRHTGSKPPQAQDPDALYMLSRHTLMVVDATSSSYDLDHVIAMILQILFQLHDGKPRLSYQILPDVGKMVNISRMMGLAVDPDDTPGKFTLFEGEMRRRVWWDVFYYDLFISDFMGQVPLIADNSYTTTLPAEVDDEVFNSSAVALPPPNDHSIQANNSYFIQKCRLAQLVKSMKKRSFTDPTQPQNTDVNLDTAIACEADIKGWFDNLHPNFKLDMDSDSASLSTPPFLVAQRCELAMVAHSLVLKLFHPFVKKSHGRPAHHAFLASVNSAHTIIHASKTAQSALRGTRPAAFLSYSFNRQLFHAAVIAANAIIQDPMTVYAAVALDDLRNAIDIMRDPAVPSSRGPMAGGVEGSLSEPLRIAEMLQKKAEEARRGNSQGAGTKRKHSDVDDHIQAGFQLPFAGPNVVTSPAGSMSPPGGMVSAASSQASGSRQRYANSETAPRAPAWTNDSASTSSLRVSTPRGERKHHPTIGVRVRANTASRVDTTNARREHAATARTPVVGSSGGGHPPQASQSPQSHGPSGGPFGPSSGPASASTSGPQPMEADYPPFAEPHHIPGRYPAPYNGGSPSGPPLFDPGFTPSQPSYYLPPPGPVSYPQQPGPSQPYENSMPGHGHGHGHGQMALMLSMAPSEMDTSPTHAHPPPSTPADRRAFAPIPEKSFSRAPHEEGSGPDSDGGGLMTGPGVGVWTPDDDRYSRWHYESASGYPAA